MVMLYSLALSAVLSHEVSSVRVYFFLLKKLKTNMLWWLFCMLNL